MDPCLYARMGSWLTELSFQPYSKNLGLCHSAQLPQPEWCLLSYLRHLLIYSLFIFQFSLTWLFLPSSARTFLTSSLSNIGSQYLTAEWLWHIHKLWLLFAYLCGHVVLPRKWSSLPKIRSLRSTLVLGLACPGHSQSMLFCCRQLPSGCVLFSCCVEHFGSADLHAKSFPEQVKVNSTSLRFSMKWFKWQS